MNRFFPTHIFYIIWFLGVMGRNHECWNGRNLPWWCGVSSLRGFIGVFLDVKGGRLLGNCCFGANLTVLFACVINLGYMVGD